MSASISVASGKKSAWLMSCLLLAGIGAGARQSAGDDGLPADGYESFGDASLPARPPPADPLRMQAFLDFYEESLESRQYQEAETAAKQRIENLIDTGGTAEAQMGVALNDLALAQRFSEQYDAALQNYFAAIQVLERSENRLSEKRIKPLRGVGDTYMASGHADLALPVYERALHLKHVNDGPHNLGQVEILDSMMLAELQAGRP